jgi:hypothetical protein
MPQGNIRWMILCCGATLMLGLVFLALKFGVAAMFWRFELLALGSAYPPPRTTHYVPEAYVA